ncbi:beta-ketoacyl synthase chain length factor [Magnetospirillum sp. UT-4]|uniref:beta-ketoacyl synthase chain length factor n=1 Tax=Magnetospirillum sp. UT-4 TaxID=2681467 RepID=UPI00137FFA2F|nr:beta-ketoacyl synthase chain length factor [Magnetospirillum sp. UT-4]CAA7626565.1 conserved exported hypothetical protein [Magnetospirillum sp. UT-4]
MVSAAAGGAQSVGFAVAAWTAWLPGRAALLSGGAVAAVPAPAGLKRRATPLGRKVLEAAWPLLADHGDSPRIVLSSRHGEYQRTLGLARALAAEEELSPAEFSLSIHHGLAALLSIATGNRAGHTAVAAGGDTFGWGCVEAAACLADGDGSVLLLHFDEPLPAEYRDIADAEEAALVLALLLRPAGGDSVRLEFEPAAAPSGDDPALRFGEMLAGGDAAAEATGERMTWRWRHAA